MSVNKVILVGRLGRDPEVRYTRSEKAVANFSIATDESFTDQSGERQKRTEWHRVVIWDKLAEIAEKYLTKGSLVYLEGRIQTKEWEDKTGVKRTDKEIICNTLRMLGSKDENTDSRPAKTNASRNQSTKQRNTPAPEDSENDDSEEIGF